MPNSYPVETQELLGVVLDSMPLRVFWKDLDLNYLGANQLFEDDAGVATVDELIGRCDYDMCWHEQGDDFRKDDREVINSGTAKLNIEEAQTGADGKTRWLLTNKVPLRDDTGHIIGVMGTYHDITEKVEYREKIESQALIDPLTNLANRRALQNTINAFQGEHAGLIFLDLDHFKMTNDSLGHAFGDVLLQLVSERLLLTINETGLVARLGGDEFSIFIPLERGDLETHQQHLEKICGGIITSLTKPYTYEKNIINLGASIGITIIDNTNKDAQYHFRNADIAMYSAKSAGRNTYRFYDQTMQAHLQRQHILQSELLHAITKNELYIVCQPQVKACGTIIGAETLLRWDNPKLGRVSPFEFIDIAEKTGFIHEIGMWVIDSALDILQSWHDILEQQKDFKLSINVSSKQFQNTYFIEKLKLRILASQIAPHHIQIEITESLFIEDKELVINAMTELKSIGVSFAIDDFGIGYSSLSYIAQLPIDQLKIDKSFVDHIDREPKNKKLIKTIITMAESLNMKVIAEGIETNTQRLLIDELGCKEFQGYFFSRPIKPEKIIKHYPKKYPIT